MHNKKTFEINLIRSNLWSKHHGGVVIRTPATLCAFETSLGIRHQTFDLKFFFFFFIFSCISGGMFSEAKKDPPWILGRCGLWASILTPFAHFEVQRSM